MKYAIVLFFFTILSCQNSSNERFSEKKSDLENYYKKEFSDKVPPNGMVIILQNQQCSSCRLITFQKLVKEIIKSPAPKTFILASRDSALTTIISEVPNSSIRIDSLHRLQDYGLNYAADLFFLFKNSELKECFELSNENLNHWKLK